MIHPSYVDLMKVVNADVEEGEEPIISSRYSIVMATARRARQLIAGDDPLVATKYGRKALSVAVEELNRGEVHILTEEDKLRMQEEIRLELEAAAAAKDADASEGGADAEGDADAGAAEASADDDNPDDEGDTDAEGYTDAEPAEAPADDDDPRES